MTQNEKIAIVNALKEKYERDRAEAMAIKLPMAEENLVDDEGNPIKTE